MGRRRAAVLRQPFRDNLVIVADINQSSAERLASEMDCLSTTDYREVVMREDVKAIIVSTANKFLLPITVTALEHGKHILCEKPLGRNADEAFQIFETARREGCVLKVGFNHRYHPAIRRAHELCRQGAIGPIMFIRAVYGHGGRPGYDKEWRGDADLAGGGELLDQGVHLVDLCRWFLGEFSEVYGSTATYFWNPGYFKPSPGGRPMPSDDQRLMAGRQLEDNAFAQMRTADGRMAQLHTSWTQWKNRFTVEIFGHDGYVVVDGLNGSYGTETLTVGYRCPQSGPPEETKETFADPDSSLDAEWAEFSGAIQEGRSFSGSGEDGLQVMRIIDALYRSALMGVVVRLENLTVPQPSSPLEYSR
jgi:predicted dehydrogenase